MVQCTAAHRIVIGHLASGIQTARARARIHAALIQARLIQITIGTRRTLRPTSRRHAHIAGQARAYRMLVDVATLAVRSARRWHARIRVHHRCDGAWYLVAGNRRIAGVAGRAAAVRCMVRHVTLGRGAADASRARIVAFLVATCSGLWAVGVHDALRSAFGVRIAEELGQASARAGTVALLADGIDAARRRVARFDGFGLDSCARA